MKLNLIQEAHTIEAKSRQQRMIFFLTSTSAHKKYCYLKFKKACHQSIRLAGRELDVLFIATNAQKSYEHPHLNLQKLTYVKNAISNL